MEIRATTAEDLPRCHEVFEAAMGELFRRHNLAPPAPPLAGFVAGHVHLLRHDPGRSFVAEEDGGIAAFVAAFVRGRTWFLASLFVRPAAQGGGVGRALLERAFPAEVDHRWTLTDSIQPVSNALYGRFGLIPTTPAITFAGESPADAPPGLEPAEPDAATLRELDLASYGFDRAVDHVAWSDAAPCTVWRRDGEPVAYSYASARGRIGPLAAVDGLAAAATLTAEIARASRRVDAIVPGTAPELVEAALAAGLRIAGPPGLLLLTPGTPPPTSIALSGYTLF